MCKWIKRDYDVLKSGKAGSRFRAFRRHKLRSNEGMLVHIITWVIALLLIGGGLAIGWLPGPGGFVAILGLALIAPYLPGLAPFLDLCELLLSWIWAKVRASVHRPSA